MSDEISLTLNESEGRHLLSVLYGTTGTRGGGRDGTHQKITRRLWERLSKFDAPLDTSLPETAQNKESEALERAVTGGISAYVNRIRDGWSNIPGHKATFFKDLAVNSDKIHYGGCSCGDVMCNAPLWLEWGRRLIASYTAKVNDFAAETLRNSELEAKIASSEVTRPECPTNHQKGVNYQVWNGAPDNGYMGYEPRQVRHDTPFCPDCGEKL